MATNIRDAFKTLTGRDVTDPEIQRIMSVAQAMNVRNDDAMIVLLMVLEHNHGIVTAAPERIKRILKEAEQSANDVALATFERATASLIPGIKDAVSSAARESVVKVQLGASMISLWFGVLLLGAVFSIGMLTGSNILSMLKTDVIRTEAFWMNLGIYVFWAAVTPMLLIMQAHADDFNFPYWLKVIIAWVAWITIFVFLTGLAILTYHSVFRVVKL